MKQDKIKKICEFNSLLSSVLWDGDKKSIKKLEALIETKTNLGFTKEEFIQECFFDETLFPVKKIEQYDEIDNFKLDFYKDSYDAVTFKTTGYSTICLLKERIDDFMSLIKERSRTN